MLKTILLVAAGFAACIVLLLLFGSIQPARPRSEAALMTYSDLLHAVDADRVTEVIILGSVLTVTETGGAKFTVYMPDDPGLVGRLVARNVRVMARPAEDPGTLHLLLSWLPLLSFTGIWLWLVVSVSRSLRRMTASIQGLTNELAGRVKL